MDHVTSKMQQMQPFKAVISGPCCLLQTPFIQSTAVLLENILTGLDNWSATCVPKWDLFIENAHLTFFLLLQFVVWISF